MNVGIRWRTEAVGEPDVERTTTTTWHAVYRIPELITEASLHNPTGHKTTDYVYNTKGWLTQVVEAGYRPDGAGGFAAVTRTTSIGYMSDESFEELPFTPYAQVEYIDGPRTDVDDTTW
jgi:hypothetical protein